MNHKTTNILLLSANRKVKLTSLDCAVNTVNYLYFSNMDNITDVRLGPLDSSKYMKPVRVYYKQVGGHNIKIGGMIPLLNYSVFSEYSN